MKNLLPMLLLLTIWGCKKDNVDKTPELLSKSWKMTAWTVLTPFEGTPLQGLSTDWFDASPCVADAISTFKIGGTFTLQTVATCNFQDTYNGVWALSNNSKVINVTFIGSGYSDFSYTIVELTSSKLIVTRLEKTGLENSEVMDLLMRYEFVPK